MALTPARVPARTVAAVALGVLLNPLNSSMIAVALLRLGAAFDASVAAASWLVSGFYLAGSVGQPLMGRLADRFGARRVYCAGLLVACAAGGLAPLAPSLGWLVGFRVLLACGTSAAFPCALVLIRTATGDPAGRPPAGAMGAVSVAASVSAALGPVLGGALIALAGWQAIFLVNVPVSLAALVLALLWLPADQPRAARSGLVHALDLPGTAMFVAALAGLLGFLLSLPRTPRWPLLPAAVAAALLLVRRELRTSEPFVDLRMLRANRALLAVFGHYALVNLVFYAAFFGLPIWFEEERDLAPRVAGLLLLPLAGVSMLVTPLAARLVNRRGSYPALVVGSVALAGGSLLLLTLSPASPVLAILVVCGVFGLPNGFNNLGLQTALYAATPPSATGSAAGLFQTFRYLGAILSTSLLGVVFGTRVTSGGLHGIAAVMAAVSLVLVAASLARSRADR